MVSILSSTELARLIQGYRLHARTEGKSDKTIAIVANSVSYFENFLRSRHRCHWSPFLPYVLLGCGTFGFESTIDLYVRIADIMRQFRSEAVNRREEGSGSADRIRRSGPRPHSPRKLHKEGETREC